MRRVGISSATQERRHVFIVLVIQPVGGKDHVSLSLALPFPFSIFHACGLLSGFPIGVQSPFVAMTHDFDPPPALLQSLHLSRRASGSSSLSRLVFMLLSFAVVIPLGCCNRDSFSSADVLKWEFIFPGLAER